MQAAWRIRPSDVLVAGILSALGVLLMVANMGTNDPNLQIDSRSILLVPVFLAVTAPLLWRRKDTFVVGGVIAAALVVHDVAFGSIIRCGVGLPVAFVLAYTFGARYERGRALWGLGLAAAVMALALVKDAAAGLDIAPVTLVLTAGAWGIGRVVRQRAAMARELEERNEELRVRRDERAALEVAVDRERLSSELDGLLSERLSALSRAAERGASATKPEAARAALAQIERDGRRTLDQMRQIVGVLRGSDAPVSPVPAVTHLDALLVRTTKADTRLTVTGDVRTLPASVELSAYRIVEQLVSSLADDPSVQIDVHMRFADDALEIRISGPVAKGADVKAAAGRARERASLHNGSLDVRVGRGRAEAVAQLPVLATV